MTLSKPSLAELRAVGQPDSVVGRANAEHWAGRLYMRHVSLHLTRALVPTRVSADAVTWWMILAGIAAAAVLAVPAWWAAALAALAIQLQLLFDCSDGELARWRGTTGPVGVYLDRIGHYLTDAGLIIALGVRVDGGYDAIGGWTTWALVGAIFVLLNKAETDLVYVARSSAGLPAPQDNAEVVRPTRSGLAKARSVAAFLPVHRAIGAIEMTLLALVAATVDAVTGGRGATEALVLVLVPVAVAVAALHLLSILSSSRFK